MIKTDMISIIVPSYNTPKDYLRKFYNSILSQSYQNFELIIVDDCSAYNYYDDVIEDKRVKLIYKNVNSGPAESRNIGVEYANSEYLFFTDADCEIREKSLEIIVSNLKKYNIVMGNTITKTKTYFGKAVAYLGFPGGGILGFDNVWKVDQKGYTNSISSCNLAIKKEVFKNIGGFNSSFPVPGGEDTTFAKCALYKGFTIKYSPEQVVYHVERNNIISFIKWQITRGKGNYHIKINVSNIDGFYKLRLWSIKNSLIKSGVKYFIIVNILWILSVFFQTYGYFKEKNKQSGNKQT